MAKKIFFDIETVREAKDYDNYNKKDIRAERYCNDIDTTEKQAYYDKAPLHPEFWKIICISVWMWGDVMSFHDSKEDIVLKDFFEFLDNQWEFVLVGHNIKSFDIPFVFRRSLINWIKPHKAFVLLNMKPREIQHIDTMEIRKETWYISTWLDLICRCLDITSPKSEFSWKEVSDYYRNNEWRATKIVPYCEWDVKATMQVYERIEKILWSTSTEKAEPKSDLISEKQVGYAMSLWTKLGLSEEQRKEYLKNRYKTDSIKTLSKYEASEFIDDLNKSNFKEVLLKVHTNGSYEGHPLQDDDLPF